MKIVHLIPGSGGTFYCQNCMRDNELIKALRQLENDVLMVPLYLPLSVEASGVLGDTPVFYGAINIYLKEKIPFYRYAPMWIEKSARCTNNVRVTCEWRSRSTKTSC